VGHSWICGCWYCWYCGSRSPCVNMRKQGGESLVDVGVTPGRSNGRQQLDYRGPRSLFPSLARLYGSLRRDRKASSIIEPVSNWTACGTLKLRAGKEEDMSWGGGCVGEGAQWKPSRLFVQATWMDSLHELPRLLEPLSRICTLAIYRRPSCRPRMRPPPPPPPPLPPLLAPWW
jgi:hypothetical protein